MYTKHIYFNFNFPIGTYYFSVDYVKSSVYTLNLISNSKKEQ